VRAAALDDRELERFLAGLTHLVRSGSERLSAAEVEQVLEAASRPPA
jgi:hypothetical protein